MKVDVKPVKQCPYRMNPKYKEKFRVELDRMLAAGIIEAMEDILSQAEARSLVEVGVRKCRISLLWCSWSYWWCRRRTGVSELKTRPLKKIRIGGASTLTALTTCNNEILRNLVPFGQDLCQIWCLQCTVMADFVLFLLWFYFMH